MTPSLLLAALLASAAEPAADASPHGLRWRAVGPLAVGEVVDVAVDPGDALRIALVDGDGDVWASDDGAITWRRVLPIDASPAGGAADAALADGGSRAAELLDDLVDDLDLDVLDPLDADALADQEDAVRDAAGAIASELADAGEGSAPAGAPVVRVGFVAGALHVGRPDGLWAAAREGWRRVLDAPTEAWVLSAGILVAGGPRGVHVVRDGAVVAASSLPPVRDLVIDVGVLAATDEGTWRSADGLAWTRADEGREGWRTLAPGPGGTVRAIDARGALRTLGGAAAPEGRGHAVALREVRDVVAAGDGTWLVAAAGGAWRTVEGGPGWSAIAPGLEHTVGRALVPLDQGLLLATDHGLFALDGAADGAVSGSPVDVVPVDLLLEAAARAVPKPRGAAGARVARWLLPTLSIEGRWTFDGRTARALDAGLSAERGAVGTVVAQLVWSPPARVSAAAVADPAGIDGPIGIDGPEEVGASDPWALHARVGRRAVDARLEVVERVRALLDRRALLLRTHDHAGSLREQVEATLRVAEVEAWIDVLTAGALARRRAEIGG